MFFQFDVNNFKINIMLLEHMSQSGNSLIVVTVSDGAPDPILSTFQKHKAYM